jgi:hypothetical protein
MVPSLGMCAIFSFVAAEAGATVPVTSVVVTRAAVAIAASSFFKVFPFVENIVKLNLISLRAWFSTETV